MRVVHLGTVVQTQFGLLDEAGNVVPQEPVTVKLQVFTEEAFLEACARLGQEREQIAALDPADPEPPE